MADSQTTILSRMLGYISDEFDKSEGTFIYDIETPVSIELEGIGVKADDVLNKGFADTATGIYLDKIANEQGISRKPATKASGIVTVTGVVGSAITAGELVASDNVNFVFTTDSIIPSSETIDVSVECESYGTVGNVPVNAIKYFPKTLEGLQTVTNTVAFKNGYNVEFDDDLRARYYTKVQTPTTSGNKYHYLNWSKDVTGVGDARVVPLWNGNGTVKVIIINSNRRAADQALIDEVNEYIGDNRPIGATVTVVSAAELPININITLTLTTGYTLDTVKSAIEANLTQHFCDIAFKDSYVSYAKIGSIILETVGVADYINLKVNNGTANISIAETEVAVLGGVTIG